MKDDLLASLEHVRWHIALRTFGNNHATLVGLLVDWWVSGAPEDRYVLESGPSFGYRPRSTRGGGQCDAILVEKEVSKGIVEVEGTRYDYTIDKMGRFFAAEYADLATLAFGVFLAYPTGARGRGKERTIHPLPLDEFVRRGQAVTKDHPGKQLAILVLDKVREPQRSGPRARTEYYEGRPAQIRGSLVQDGKELARRVLMPKR